MYPEIMVIPMREELTRAGLKEVRSAAEVDAALTQTGTTMVVVNSICGCAAGKMGVLASVWRCSTRRRPDHSGNGIRWPGPRGYGEGAWATSRGTLRPLRRLQFYGTGSWCT